MKAVVFHGIGDIRLDDVPEPAILQPADAIVRMRIPFAATGLVKLPEIIDDDQAILLSDIFPTACFGADLAEIEAGDTVAIFGCGPVGQFAVAAARLHDAGRIYAVDCIPSRLEMARRQGAEAIDFNKEDPVEAGLVDLVAAGVVDPSRVLTHTEPLTDAIEAYKAFDRRDSGWLKVELRPASARRKAA